MSFKNTITQAAAVISFTVGCSDLSVTPHVARADASNTIDGSITADASHRNPEKDTAFAPDTSKQVPKTCAALQEKLNKVVALIEGQCPIEDKELDTIDVDFLKATQSILEPFEQLIQSGKFTMKWKELNPIEGVLDVVDEDGKTVFGLTFHAGEFGGSYEIYLPDYSKEVTIGYKLASLNGGAKYLISFIAYNEGGVVLYTFDFDKQQPGDLYPIEKAAMLYDCGEEQILTAKICNPAEKKIVCQNDFVDDGTYAGAGGESKSLGYSGCSTGGFEIDSESTIHYNDALALSEKILLPAQVAIEKVLAMQDKHNDWKEILWWHL